jgi:hypothetical protein
VIRYAPQQTAPRRTGKGGIGERLISTTDNTVRIELRKETCVMDQTEATAREQLLSRAFVSLADTLVDAGTRPPTRERTAA